VVGSSLAGTPRALSDVDNEPSATKTPPGEHNPVAALRWGETRCFIARGFCYTQISSFSLLQVWRPPCRPLVTAPSSFPVSLGDIPAAGTATTSFTVDFGRCSPFALFDLSAPWTSATYETGRVFVTRIHP
jgi:hypothetical protein